MSTHHSTAAARRRLALLAVLALILTACGNSGSDDTTSPTTSGSTSKTTAGGSSITGVPGVTNDAINYAVIGTKANNPLGTCILDCFQAGIQAYFDYRNADGGIYGRQLKIAKTLDDELSQNQVRALEVTTSNDYFGDFNATLVASGWGDLDKAGVPTYGWGINFPEATGRPHVFMNSPVQCGPCTTHAVPYAAKIVKAKNVASLGYGISQSSKVCASAVADSVKLYSDVTGEKLAYFNDNLDFGLPNGIGPEVTAMKKAGVDFISTCIDLNGMKTLGQELERQGMTDVHLYHPDTYDLQFLKESRSLFEGDVVSTGFRPFEATPSSGMKQFQKWMNKAGKPVNDIAMHGWINADLAYQGLKAAGPQFDREKVVAATNKLTNYTADGIIPPIDWTRQHEPPTQADPVTHGPKQECFAFVRIERGAYKMVAPKDKPFLCWDNSTRDWSEPFPTDFK